MLKEERLNFILNEVKVRNRVLLSDLAVSLNVSEDTVRRDLKQLDEEGKIKKVHGGAISNSFHLYSYKEQEIYAHEDKSVIAKKAHGLLQDGQVILMSGGTTNLEFARLLPANFFGTIFTPSLLVAMELSEHPAVETILIGGKLSSESQIALGSEAINRISQIRADLCLLGTSYLDAEFGLSEIDLDVAELKKAMINASRKIISLTISEKINSVQRFKVCEAHAIHALITERKPDDHFLDPFRKKGLEIL